MVDSFSCSLSVLKILTSSPLFFFLLNMALLSELSVNKALRCTLRTHQMFSVHTTQEEFEKEVSL